jgi:hypothetical protein
MSDLVKLIDAPVSAKVDIKAPEGDDCIKKYVGYMRKGSATVEMTPGDITAFILTHNNKEHLSNLVNDTMVILMERANQKELGFAWDFLRQQWFNKKRVGRRIRASNKDFDDIYSNFLKLYESETQNAWWNLNKQIHSIFKEFYYCMLLYMNAMRFVAASEKK